MDKSHIDIAEMAEDIMKIKNDLSIVKANTQISANLLSIIHGGDIVDIVLSVAHNEKLCQALMFCNEPRTAKELCEKLSIKPSNIRKQIIDKLLDASFLTVVDKKGQSECYRRAMFIDMIGFDKVAIKKYPQIGESKK